MKWGIVCHVKRNMYVSTWNRQKTAQRPSFHVGEPGIEPGPLGPKPSTLPLCYTPIEWEKRRSEVTWTKTLETKLAWLSKVFVQVCVEHALLQFRTKREFIEDTPRLYKPRWARFVSPIIPSPCKKCESGLGLVYCFIWNFLLESLIRRVLST